MNSSEPEKPFEEPWQAEAFAMVVNLHARGKFTWSEWADVLGAKLKSKPEKPYYESWLAALEQITENKKLIDHDERHERIEAWDRAAHATPHGQPILLENGTSR